MAPRTDKIIRIQYIIKVPENDVVDPYTWPNRFDKHMVRTASILATIARLPKDIAEIFTTKEVSIRNRMTGWFDGYLIRHIRNFQELNTTPYLFNVVFTEDRCILDERDVPTILVFTGDISKCQENEIHISQLTPAIFKARVLLLISALTGTAQTILDELRDCVGYENGHQRIATDIEVATSPYTRATLTVLDSLRVDVKRNGTTTEYSEADTARLINLVNYIRRSIADNLDMGTSPNIVSYYITDDSSNLEFASNRSAFTEASLRNAGIANPREFMDAIKIADTGKSAQGFLNNPYLSDLDGERILIENIIALAASNHACPVIKLPISNNAVFPQVKDFATVERKGGGKTNVMMQRLREKLAAHLDGALKYLDSSAQSTIKLISNLPLEWGFHQGLPLMVRHDVSRMSLTPGYVSAPLLLASSNVQLSLDAFHQILFISSFKDDDPIREHLKSAIDVIKRLTEPEAQIIRLKEQGLLPGTFTIPAKDHRLDVKIVWRNVANRSDLIDAINQNPCAITVFDLHGSHGSGGALLHLRDEAMSVSDIRNRIQISPIIIMSSCDSSPVDKAYDSTASALFMSGARALISSSLPINSRLSAIFLARLVERIQSYLPAKVLSDGKPIRWSTFVSGMIRRTYFSELVSLLQKDLGFSKEKKSQLLLRIGLLIDPLSNNWVEATKHEITTQIGVDETYLDRFVQQKAQFLECLKYVQLGAPESIIISE